MIKNDLQEKFNPLEFSAFELFNPFKCCSKERAKMYEKCEQ